MRGIAGLAVLVALTGCDLVFSPGKGPSGGDDVPGEWTELSVGYDHSCAVASDSSLWCWGHNDLGEVGDNTQRDRSQPTRIGGTAQWSKVSAGDFHTCAIQTDGQLYCWGYDYYGELGGGTPAARITPAQIIDHATWREVSAGSRVTCGIKTDDTLWCWGDNEYGELGNGFTSPSATPIQVEPGTTWVHVDAGGQFACGIKTGNTLWCWGDNTYDELGYTGTGSPTPVQLGGDTDWTEIAVSTITGCGLRGTTAECWGYNAAGQCGIGNTDYTCAPSLVTGPVSAWRSIEVGFRHSCGVADDGGLWCWGREYRGSFGDEPDAFTVQPTPVQVPMAPRTYARVSLGDSMSCALGDDGAIDCTGTNNYGQLGDGTGGARFAPTQVVGLQGATAILTGGVEYGYADFSCAALPGALWCWGSDYSAQLAHDGLDARQPLLRDTIDFAELAGGAGHACGQERGTGELQCWGDNSFGQIGDGSTNPASTPFSHGTGWKKFAASYHSCAISETAELWCWGRGGNYQLGTGLAQDEHNPIPITSMVSPTQITAGARHTCSIDSDKLLWCWGYNADGELGLGDTDDRAGPTQLGGSMWDELDAGDYHTCATAGGVLYCWGYNAYGQLGIGTGGGFQRSPAMVSAALPWKQVAAGGYHTCAIADDETLWCWGDNTVGQVGVPSAPSNVLAPIQVGTDHWTAIDAAEAHTCGIRKDDGTVWCWGYNASGEIGDGSAWRGALGPIGSRGN